MRRINADEYQYDFKRSGAFGIFKSNGSIPVEYLMTSFSIDDIPNLSFARDVSSSLNFDYLIQRDIDQERALSDISRYISANDTSRQKEIVFLPPILVSIVETDSHNNLIEYYPDSIFKSDDDGYGEVYIREWPGLFKVTNYGAKTGNQMSFDSADNGTVNKTIDFGQSKIEVNLTKKKVKGGKLVVIDGQHRLYALEHLRVHEYKKVENIVLPVCIIYSPHSCLCFGDEAIMPPSIPSFMRSLFVDVNSTVERVSGHFLILLQDSTLGSIICRDFCNTILSNNKLGTEALALVEWNTKNHKESLTITREHTLTSIGVINSAFEEVFKTQSGIKLISDIIGLNKNSSAFDFGVDEYDQMNVMPKDFPWRDFSLQHKARLTELVNKTITNCLVRIFFETKHYTLAFNLFSKELKDVIDAVITNRDPLSDSAEIVRNHLLYNDPISNDEKSARALLSRFQESYSSKRDLILPSIARKTIFQKSIVESWYKILEILLPRNITVDSCTSILIVLIESALDNNSIMFDLNRPHVQGTIFDGNRVKVTLECKKQISRLMLAKLANVDFCKDTCNSLGMNNSDEIINSLYSLGVRELSLYYQKMMKDKKASFVKTYKSNFTISSYVREKLIAEEERRDLNLKNAKDSASKIEASKGFDELIMSILAEEFEVADQSLARCFNQNSSSIIYIINGSEED